MKKIILTLLVTLGTFAQAENLRPLFQLSYDLGGDDLVTIAHDYERDYTISAGDGLRFEVGMAIDNPQSNVEIQLLAGYKFDSDNAGNGDILWSSVPLTALALVEAQSWKFGGGLTYHINPELHGTFGKDNINYEFENAFGGILQIQYAPVYNFAIGLRATLIDYTLNSDPTQTASGNSLGLVGTFKFGGNRSRFR